MKSAMLLEYDEGARGQTAAVLKSLGYLVAYAATPRAALQSAQALRFDVVLTCTDFNAADRRSFVGELARLAPGATIVYLLDSDATGCGRAERASALLFKPVTLGALRRVLEFGVDGLGQRQVCMPPERERRRMPQRRLRTR